MSLPLKNQIQLIQTDINPAKVFCFDAFLTAFPDISNFSVFDGEEYKQAHLIPPKQPLLNTTQKYRMPQRLF